MAPTTRKRSEKNNKIEVTEDDRLPGVVYIGHIPHGFYEKEIKQYFSQFGKVLGVKVSRSKKNGNAKGYAFVKFKYSAVAKTVAETCHNYLFFNKLLKCQYKPLSEVHPKTFVTYPLKPNLKKKREHNNNKPEDKLKSSLSKSIKRQEGKLKKLKDLGLDLKLSDILDVPDSKGKKSPKKSLTPKKKTPMPRQLRNRKQTVKAAK
ncbi:hypothetical protein Btru_051022 [Bulinus truncatus]|nr:hypothetical protein Btru_051022 [Bulinus truncatus]